MVNSSRNPFGAGISPVGIVSGSGINLRPLLDEVLGETSFVDAAGISAAGIAGHEGTFVFGYCAGVPVVLQAGRIHLYEGHSVAMVATTVDALYRFGVRALILTNAVGGLDDALVPGDLVAASEVLCWQYRSHNFPQRMQPAFVIPGCTAAGTYIWMHGPCYETRAEIAALRRMGGMTVGMSIAVELERCMQRGIRAGVVSCVTNDCTSQEVLSHEQVVATAARSSDALCRTIRAYLRAHVAPVPELDTDG